MMTSRLCGIARLARMFALALLALAASARASPATPPVGSSDEKTTTPWWRGSSLADPRREGTRGDHHQPLSAVDPSRLVVATAEGVHRPDGAWSVPGWSVDVAPDDGTSSDAATWRASPSPPPPPTRPTDRRVLPARANVTATAPTRYVILHEADPAYLTAGVAVVRVRLVCARADHDVVVFADDWVTRQGWRQDLERLAVAVARSPRVSVPEADGPRNPASSSWPRNRRRRPAETETETIFSTSTTRPPSRPRLRTSRWRGTAVATRPIPRVFGGGSLGSPEDAGVARDDDDVRARGPADGVGVEPDTRRIVGAPPGRTVAYELLTTPGKVSRRLRTRRVARGAARGRSRDARDGENDGTAFVDAAFEPVVLVSSLLVGDVADSGRGTDDDSVTWQECARVERVPRAGARDDEARAQVDAFLFGDLSYAAFRGRGANRSRRSRAECRF